MQQTGLNKLVNLNLDANAFCQVEALAKAANDLGINPSLVCEVGVGESLTRSQVQDFFTRGVPAILVEALPKFYQNLRREAASFPNIQLHGCAIYKEEGSVKLYDRSLASFVSGVISPSVTIDKYQESEADAVVVPAYTFDRFDPGNIDILALDMEGAEFYVLERLKSRPKLISVETLGMVEWGHEYINPKLGDIIAWMEREGYGNLGQVNADTYFARI